MRRTPPGPACNSTIPSPRRWRGVAVLGVACLLATVFGVVSSGLAASPSPLTLRGEKPYYSFSSQSLFDRMGLAVNVASGNLLVQADDVRIAGTRLDLDISRFYNSQSGLSTDFGGYWTMGSGADVHVAYNTPASGDATFYGPSGYQDVLTPNGSGGFNPPDGLDASLTHNSGGTSTLTFDRDGETYTFNAAGQLQSDADRNHNTVTYNYTSGHLSSIVDTRGRTLTVTTNSSGQITKLQDSSGRTWTYCYNSAGDLTQSTDSNGKSTYYQYTGSHLLSQITDPNGNVTKITYGSGGQVASISRAPASSGGSAETTKFAYSLAPSSPCPSSAYGETTVTDPNGHNTIYCYDGSGRSILTQNPDGHQTTQTWGQDDLPAVATTPDQAAGGVNTTLSYDKTTNAITGITIQTGASSSVEAKLAYDASAGNINPYKNFFPYQATDTQGNTTTYGYDKSGNLTSIKNPLGANETLAYNNQGEVTSVTDGDGHSRSYIYDSEGQLTTLNPPSPSSLKAQTIGYDGLSRITSVSDANGKRTYCYDGMDRVTQITFGDGSKENYTYDADGNLVSRTDTSASGSSQTTTYTYDALNRLTGTSFPAGQHVTYGYDAANNLTSYTDGGGTVTYGYDPANLLTSLTDPVGTTTFGYTAGGKRNSTTFPSGAKETFGFDPAGRMKSLSILSPSGAVLASDNYSYTNASGADTLLIQSVSDNAGNNTVYSYDAANQLKEAKTTNGSATTDDYQYTYDPAGNHTSQTTMYNGGASTQQTLTYNAANQLCWSIVGAPANPSCSSTPSGATVFSYDGNGNETGSTYDGGYQLTWNAENQMTSERDCGTCSATQYSYLGTGQGERVQEGSTTFENSALGISQSANGGTTTSYTRDPDGLVIDSRQPGGTGQFYVYDALGNVIGLLDHTGALHRTYKYGPAGGVSKDSGTSFDTAIRYRGAWNGAGNMFHFGARDYDPILREWTQVDPIDQPQDLRDANWYVYAGNDPINLYDTNGESTLGDVAAGAGFGFASLACGTVTDGFGAGVCTGGLASGAAAIGVAGSGSDSSLANGLAIGASAAATVVGCATAETGVGAVACAGGIASLAGSVADLL